MAYEKNIWENGDIVTDEKLNHMEDGIEEANALNLKNGTAQGSLRGVNTAIEDGSSYTIGINALAEGANTRATGNGSHAEGIGSLQEQTYKDNTSTLPGATAMASHVEGYNTSVKNNMAGHAEGYQTLASGMQPGDHAEGYNTVAKGGASHAEGNGTIASGNSSHAEGDSTTASGVQSHAEGYKTTTNGVYSHAEGQETSTSSSAAAAHAEGAYTEAAGLRRTQKVRNIANLVQQ